jgi:large subunit ribosomal protein L13
MKVIDGKGAVLGRIAGYAAKQSLKGEEIAIINCEEIIISGSRKNIEKEFQEKRGRVGHSQKGPKISRSNEKLVKRSIRGMLPDHRRGRGKEAFKRIKCYSGLPKQFENEKIISFSKEKKKKFLKIKEIFREK